MGFCDDIACIFSHHFVYLAEVQIFFLNRFPKKSILIREKGHKNLCKCLFFYSTPFSALTSVKQSLAPPQTSLLSAMTKLEIQADPCIHMFFIIWEWAVQSCTGCASFRMLVHNP